MKRWAVSCINFYDHDLTTIIVKAESWFEALMQHESVKGTKLPDTDLDAAKEEAFNCDCMIEVIEIPDPYPHGVEP